MAPRGLPAPSRPGAHRPRGKMLLAAEPGAGPSPMAPQQNLLRENKPKKTPPKPFPSLTPVTAKGRSRSGKRSESSTKAVYTCDAELVVFCSARL